jgi:hypothetical protein
VRPLTAGSDNVTELARSQALACDLGRIGLVAEISVCLPSSGDLAIKREPDFLALRASIEGLVRAEHRHDPACGGVDARARAR